MLDLIGEIIAIFALYGISATMSGSEAALFSLKPHDLEALGPRARRINALLSDPRRLLIVILMCNLLVNTLSAGLVEGVAERLLGHAGVPAAIVLQVLLILILGEVAPQTFALHHNRRFAAFTAPFIRFLSFVGRPIVALVFPITAFLTRRFEGAPDERVSKEDIKYLVSHSEDIGVLDGTEERMIHSIFDLDRKKAFDVMVPKERIFALPKDVDYNTAISEMTRTHFSRVPLYAGTLDQIVGILYVKDLMIARAKGQEVKPIRIAREPIFVPRWKRCDLLLNDLRARKTHMAVVVDEFGSTAGLITLETIIEVIIGRMRDRRREMKKR